MPHMPDIAREAWDAAIHRHDQAPTVAGVLHWQPLISVPITPAIPTAQEDRTMAFASPIRHDLETVLTVLGGIAPRIIAVAEDKRVDELVEVALSAAGLGVADEVFAAATDALRAASARKAPAQQPPVTA